MAGELTLRIIIEQPPTGVDYALQKGSGSVYETVQKQRSQGQDLIFEFQPSIREGVSDSMAALGGPFVQGPPRQRFVYIDIGTCAGQAGSCWSRRLKIPLEGIPSKAIGAGGVLEARVPGTGRDGGDLYRHTHPPEQVADGLLHVVPPLVKRRRVVVRAAATRTPSTREIPASSLLDRCGIRRSPRSPSAVPCGA